MPRCTNGRAGVEDTWRYRGQCGAGLSERIRGTDETPPSTVREGFLSPNSIKYLNDLLTNDLEVERDTLEYRQLSRDIHAALVDFGMVVAVDELTMIGLFLSSRSRMTDDEEDRVALAGLFQLLELYDRSIDVEWSTEFEEMFYDRLRTIAGEVEGLSWPENEESSDSH